MEELKRVNDALYKYVRLQTHPLAVRMCASDEKVPEDAKFPKRDLQAMMPVCQTFAIAAKRGWTMALGLEDQQCPLGNVAMGFVKAKKAFLDGTFHWSWLPPGEPNAKYAQSLKRLEYGKYSHILMAPIEKATFEPHFLLIYGNPGQVVRMVQARLYLQGGMLTASAGLGGSCAIMISQTMLTDECQYVLLGSGPRRFAHAQDHEMVFTIPASKMELLVKGLEESEVNSTYTYPPPVSLIYEDAFPPRYQELQKFLMEEGD